MTNTFDEHEPRVGFVKAPGDREDDLLPCTITLGPGGPVAYLQHDEMAPWTARISEWHSNQEVPPTLYFHDTFGHIVLTGVRWTNLNGYASVHGRVRLEADVTLMGEASEAPEEIGVTEVHSRFDGLVDFAGRRALDLDRQLDDAGRPSYVVTIAPNESLTWTHGDLEYTIHASSEWKQVGRDDFNTESQAWISTKSVDAMSVHNHLRQQRKVRALVMFSEGRGLYWREHRVQDALFDGPYGPQWVETFISALYRERTLPPQKGTISKLFRLEHLEAPVLSRWIDLCDDPALRRALGPFTDNLVEHPRFVELNVMTRAMALDAIGHYWLGKPERSKAMYLNVEECINRSGIDVSLLGSSRELATAISNLNNDVKHVDRPLPDEVGLLLANTLLEVLIRAQVFPLLGLQDDLRDQFTKSWAVRGVFQEFSANGLVLRGEKDKVRFTQRPR